MSLNIRITVNDSAAKKLFKNLARNLNNMHPAFVNTKKYQLDQIKKQFETEGKQILGRKWKPLKRSTIEARGKRRGYYKKAPNFGASASRPVLTWTGNLRKSFRAIKLTKSSLEITSKVPYFEYPQLGNRQVLGHSKKMEKETIRIFQKHILNRL